MARTGRPPLYGVRLQTRIVVPVTTHQRQHLRRLASARHTSIAGVVREAVDDAIERAADDDGDDPDDRR